jgi:ABC-2 type transport system ATP-binding protein
MKRLVIVENLVRNFEVVERRGGVGGALFSLLAPKKKTVKALRKISFSLSEGELVGFIGPNGAGKTTTLKILSGVLYPTSGYVQVDGFTPWERDNRYLKEISLVMGQKNQLWWDLPAAETFELNRAIYEVPKKVFKENLDELVNLLDVGKILSTPVRRLSLGQRMRLELVAALVHGPKIIFLDEPTIGLDVIAQQKMRDFVLDYNRRKGATVILTSHNMDDVANLAKRVVVIDEGRVVFDGELRELAKRFSKEKIIKIYADEGVDYGKLEKIGRVVKISLPEVTLAVPRGAAKMAASELLQSFAIDDLTIEEEPLEAVIRRVFSMGKPA